MINAVVCRYGARAHNSLRVYGLRSYGLYSYGLYSYGPSANRCFHNFLGVYGLRSYGLYRVGLYRYGLYSCGLCSRGSGHI